MSILASVSSVVVLVSHTAVDRVRGTCGMLPYLSDELLGVHGGGKDQQKNSEQ